jgi:hypothetical protein
VGDDPALERVVLERPVVRALRGAPRHREQDAVLVDAGAPQVLPGEVERRRVEVGRDLVGDELELVDAGGVRDEDPELVDDARDAVERDDGERAGGAGGAVDRRVGAGRARVDPVGRLLLEDEQARPAGDVHALPEPERGDRRVVLLAESVEVGSGRPDGRVAGVRPPHDRGVAGARVAADPHLVLPGGDAGAPDGRRRERPRRPVVRENAVVGCTPTSLPLKSVKAIRSVVVSVAIELHAEQVARLVDGRADLEDRDAGRLPEEDVARRARERAAGVQLRPAEPLDDAAALVERDVHAVRCVGLAELGRRVAEVEAAREVVSCTCDVGWRKYLVDRDGAK